MDVKGLKLHVFGMMMTVAFSACATEPAQPTRDCVLHVEAALDWVKSGVVTRTGKNAVGGGKETVEKIAEQVEKIRKTKGDCAAYDTVAEWLANQD